MDLDLFPFWDLQARNHFLTAKDHRNVCRKKQFFVCCTQLSDVKAVSVSFHSLEGHRGGSIS